VDAIAEAAGVTKRTLYQHFTSKDAMVAAMLDQHHAHALAQIQNWGGAGADTPSGLISGLFAGLRLWADDPNWHGSGFTRLTMELADLPGHPARTAAHLHKSIVEHWLAKELQELGAPHPAELARHVILLIEGCLSLVLIHRETNYITAAEEAAQRLALPSER
jgi:AcrR family transcriptional regulator